MVREKLGAQSLALAHPSEAELRAAQCRITTDDVAIGAGCTDRLRELAALVDPFNGAATPRSQPERFLNRRSEAYFGVREGLLRNSIALPPDEALATELLATSYMLTANGRIALVSKDEIRTRVGRSPDRADTISVIFAPTSTATTHVMYI